jgi:hypothetical protein
MLLDWEFAKGGLRFDRVEDLGRNSVSDFG